MLADDSKCYRIINNDADFSNLQQDLFLLTTWSLSNELYFQPTKCSNLRTSKKRISPYRSYTCSIYGIDVEAVSTEKDLGVVIVNDTSSKDHILTRDYQGKRVNPHIGPLTKVTPLNLFLDIVPNFFADIIRALRGCFRGGSVYVSFRFVSKQRKTFKAVGMSFLVCLETQLGV